MRAAHSGQRQCAKDAIASAFDEKRGIYAPNFEEKTISAFP